MTLKEKKETLASFYNVVNLAKITVADQIAKNPNKRDRDYRKIGALRAMESIDHLEAFTDRLASEIAEIEKGV